MSNKQPHSVYQKTLTECLARWQRRRARPLDPEWREAALLLLRLDLEPVRPLLESLYSPSPRGRPPYDPTCLLRAWLLMTILKQLSIEQFAHQLRRNPRLATIAGFTPFQTPAVGTFYAFVDRLEDGPFQPACPHRVRPSQLRKQQHQRNLKHEKAQREAQRKQLLAQADSLTQALQAELLRVSDQPRPHDLLKRLEDLLFKTAVLPSAQRGLLGDLRHLILAGDGSALPTGASGVGQPTCLCRAQGLSRCECPRVYSDPTADWGWDSYREVYFFGHTFYQHIVSSASHDLPVHLLLGPASETDFTLSLVSLDRFGKTCADHDLSISIEAVAYDAGHDALGIYEYLLEKSIAPVIALNPRSGQPPLPTGTAQQINEQGIPLCPAGLPMRRHSTTPNHRIVFHCPVKRPTHSHGAHAWNAFPDRCPLTVLCQPDTKMGPVVYVRSDADPRFYPPIPRHSSRFQQIMNLRSGCERSNSVKKTVHHLDHRPCRSATHFLFRLYLVSILEHAKAWLAEDRKRVGHQWQQLADLSLITSVAVAA